MRRKLLLVGLDGDRVRRILDRGTGQPPASPPPRASCCGMRKRRLADVRTLTLNVNNAKPFVEMS